MVNQREEGKIFNGKCYLPGVACLEAEAELARLREDLYFADLEIEGMLVQHRFDLNDVREEAYEKGFQEGEETTRSDDNDDYYDNGYDDGYEDGYRNGRTADDDNDNDK